MVVHDIKHSDFKNQSPSEKIIPAQNHNEIIYGCCASIIMVNKTGSCTLDVLKTIRSSNVEGFQASAAYSSCGGTKV